MTKYGANTYTYASGITYGSRSHVSSLHETRTATSTDQKALLRTFAIFLTRRILVLSITSDTSQVATRCKLDSRVHRPVGQLGGQIEYLIEVFAHPLTSTHTLQLTINDSSLGIVLGKSILLGL